ncbi:hypothetical protein [Lunatimonas salinarum]|uniref:hypothetical protein n=1 Tax=Lunatimonas salinarum TaxID=1774590 RepID=UPI001ADFA4BF|nr:hypothetical protein [Lunatimonas salinarum]
MINCDLIKLETTNRNKMYLLRQTFQINIRRSGILMTIAAVLFFETYAQTQLPQSIAPSPSIAELGRYGSFPVSKSTGIPDIGFPLFEVNAAEISIPFSLSYHAGGIKVSQESTEVGLGWAINGVMFIHRTVMGIPDESVNGNFNTLPLSISNLMALYSATGSQRQTDWGKLQAMANGAGLSDIRADMFNYSIAGKSGQFAFAPDRTFKTFPYEPIKITRNGSGFEIVNESGTLYLFQDVNNILIDNQSSYITHNYVKDWYLTKIISNTKQDTVYFEYENATSVKSQKEYSQVIGRAPDFSSGSAGSVIISPQEASTTSIVSQQERYIKKITSRNSEIVFTYSTSRVDRSGAKKLIDIVIKDSNENAVKKFVFAYDYFAANFHAGGFPDTDTKRLKLTGFKEIAVGTSGLEKAYTFEYNNNIPIPRKGSFSMDYWGFFNGVNNNSLIPRQTVTAGQISSPSIHVIGTAVTPSNEFPSQSWSVGLTSTNRSVDTTKVQTCILKKITYPTKGFTTFQYESHAYTSNLSGTPSTAFGAGLRIKKIASYASTGQLAGLEEYKYGVGENGVGVRIFNENQFFQNFDDYTIEAGNPSDCFQWISCWQRKYYGVDAYSTVSYNGMPLVYTEVNKYTGTNSAESLRSKYEFRMLALSLVDNEFINTSSYGTLNPVWSDFQLTSETIYKKNGSNFDPIRKTELEYEIKHNSSFDGIVLFERQKVPLQYGSCYLGDPWFIDQSQFKYISRAYKLTHKTEKIISYLAGTSHEMVVETDFEYDNPNHLFVTKTISTGSDGIQNEVKVFYPDDVTSASILQGGVLTTAEYNAVGKLKRNDQHRIAEPIQVEIWKEGELLSINRTNYKLWSNGLYLPEIIKSSKSNGVLVNKLRYHTYDGIGNPTSMSQENGTTVTNIWGYKNSLPIARISNAITSEVSFTSFETGEKGGWTYSGSPVTSAISKTGTKYYNLSSGAVSKSGFGGSSSNPFVVSLWARRASGSGNWTVIGKTVSLTTEWQLVEATITGNSVSISGSGIYIDELRLHPADAQMTSYTYKLLTGISSETDPNGMVMYYEYDEIGRISLVKDTEGNILKAYDYNYQ